MKFYVMSGDMYASGDRQWVWSKSRAFRWESSELENAKWHALSFRDRTAQEALENVHRRPDIPGHRDARVVGVFDD